LDEQDDQHEEGDLAQQAPATGSGTVGDAEREGDDLE